jgi:hypothetical protein
MVWIGSVSAFTVPSRPPQLPPPEVAFRNFAGSLVAASTILSNVVLWVPAPADATTAATPTPSTTTTSLVVTDASTQILLAARSGGRAGGRSSSSRSAGRSSMSTPSRRSVSSPSTILERRTTVIQQPVYSAPTVIMSPGYYAPQPSGLGLAIGLNAVSGIADGFREARQENEIRSTRDQLTEARVKEAEMEARLRQLEQQQVTTR